jgi:hypothetical protein
VASFRTLRAMSFAHSVLFAALLWFWLVRDSQEPETFVLGLSHGIAWIAMSLLVVAAARRRAIPFWLAVTVSVLGTVGPFLGSIGFVVEQRRRARIA